MLLCVQTENVTMTADNIVRLYTTVSPSGHHGCRVAQGLKTRPECNYSYLFIFLRNTFVPVICLIVYVYLWLHRE